MIFQNIKVKLNKVLTIESLLALYNSSPCKLEEGMADSTFTIDLALISSWYYMYQLRRNDKVECTILVLQFTDSGKCFFEVIECNRIE